MKRLTAAIYLTLAVLLGDVGVVSADNLWSALKSDNHLRDVTNPKKLETSFGPMELARQQYILVSGADA
jgi:hypothetical protein